jgi:hypothetical protein
MSRRPLLLAVALVALAALGTFVSSALAELTVNERFEYESPGMTFEAQHVGPAHCVGRYQVNPKRFPQKFNEEGGLRPWPEGGREVVSCHAKHHQQLETNIAPGAEFPRLNPESDYWVSYWYHELSAGPHEENCFMISLPKDNVHGKILSNGRGYHVVAYFEYTRECHYY